MKKIPSLFARNYDGDRLVRNEVVPGCEWVLAGEGVATRKWDGTSCLVQGGKLFKRYDSKHPDRAPAEFIPADEHDPVNKHYLGWLPVGDGPEDKYHREAWIDFSGADGTYELIGPKIQGGAESGPTRLVRHGADEFPNFPRHFDGIRDHFFNYQVPGFEGIVFHHPDGRMAKVKAKDFGIKRWGQVTANG